MKKFLCHQCQTLKLAYRFYKAELESTHPTCKVCNGHNGNKTNNGFNVNAKKRNCLKCNEEFTSLRDARVCNYCKRSKSWIN